MAHRGPLGRSTAMSLCSGCRFFFWMSQAATVPFVRAQGTFRPCCRRGNRNPWRLQSSLVYFDTKGADVGSHFSTFSVSWFFLFKPRQPFHATLHLRGSSVYLSAPGSLNSSSEGRRTLPKTVVWHSRAQDSRIVMVSVSLTPVPGKYNQSP